MPPILAFSGFSQSGKTTLLKGVVAILAQRGIRVGVVKHHGHGGRQGQVVKHHGHGGRQGQGESLNPPGKDSRVLLEAGAAAVALTGPGQEAIFRPQPGDPGPMAAAAGLGRMDLVLAEGFKSWSGFKVEVIGPGAEPVLGGDPLLLAAAGPVQSRPALPPLRWFDRDEPEAVADFVTACFIPPDRLGPVPDREACFGLMARLAMRPNILVHSLVVTEVALWLAAALVRSGRDLDLPLVESGALLHDIAKTECLGGKCDHVVRGHDILFSLGFPGLARVVSDHVDSKRARTEQGLISPSVVVSYADKRVLHDEVVSLVRRAEDLLRRYGRTPEQARRIKELISYCSKMEGDLFKNIDLKPDDLDRVNHLFDPVE
ncbi:MAG: molybdopterin-guanine dinucleotide biosynthesis protein MobB [Deltaproteobacteria bacterium]|nr:molybdopterin-guanine dinucleotide biosynthesis protein MobB [Deltaproteobacteria bacterium]